MNARAGRCLLFGLPLILPIITGCVDNAPSYDLVVESGETLHLVPVVDVPGSVIVEHGATLVLDHVNLAVGQSFLVHGELLCSNSTIEFGSGGGDARFSVLGGRLHCQDSHVTSATAVEISKGAFTFTRGSIGTREFHLDGGHATLTSTSVSVPRRSQAGDDARGEILRVTSGHLRVADTAIPGAPIALERTGSARFINVALAHTQFTGPGVAEVGDNLRVTVRHAMGGAPVTNATVTVLSLAEDGLEESRGVTNERGRVTLDIIEYTTTGGPDGMRPRDPHEVVVAEPAARTVVIAAHPAPEALVLVPPGQ